ncbi:MAG: tripartite tricarboxylate transporter substrate binding protein [Ideonella sp.]|nr:tripartite tricarboxylate transporter substrate binding protein [Ideonella sp.]
MSLPFRPAATRRQWLATAAALGVTLAWSLPPTVHAAFPDKPIRIVVPYSAGGGTDIIARHLAQRLQPRLGQTVLVENRPGADGVIGTDAVVKSPPDGSSFVLVVASHLINPLVIAKMPYDTYKDMIGVTMVAESPLVFVTHVDVPAKNARELAELIRKTPAKYSYGSSENMTRLVGAMFVQGQKLDAVHVPYKGGGPLMTDVAGGVTTLGVTSVLSAKQLMTAGKLKALGITGAKRSPVLPDVPTMVELGYPNFADVRTTYSLFAPAATPREVLDRMQKEVAAVIQTPEMIEILAAQAASPVGNSVTDFNEQVKRDAAFWGGLAKSINLKPE